MVVLSQFPVFGRSFSRKYATQCRISNPGDCKDCCNATGVSHSFGRHCCKKGTHEEKYASLFTQLGISLPVRYCNTNICRKLEFRYLKNMLDYVALHFGMIPRITSHSTLKFYAYALTGIVLYLCNSKITKKML